MFGSPITKKLDYLGKIWRERYLKQPSEVLPRLMQERPSSLAELRAAIAQLVHNSSASASNGFSFTPLSGKMYLIAGTYINAIVVVELSLKIVNVVWIWSPGSPPNGGNFLPLFDNMVEIGYEEVKYATSEVEMIQFPLKISDSLLRLIAISSHNALSFEEKRSSQLSYEATLMQSGQILSATMFSNDRGACANLISFGTEATLGKTATLDDKLKYAMSVDVPTADVRAIGTDAGSSSRIVESRMLDVGTESTEALPGFVYYDHGSTRLAITNVGFVPDAFGASWPHDIRQMVTMAKNPNARKSGKMFMPCSVGTKASISSIASDDRVGASSVDARRYILSTHGGCTLSAAGGYGTLYPSVPVGEPDVAQNHNFPDAGNGAMKNLDIEKVGQAFGPQRLENFNVIASEHVTAAGLAWHALPLSW